MNPNLSSCSNITVDVTNDPDNWNQYLLQHPESNFYQRFEWKGINERNFGHRSYYLSAYSDNSTVGALPLTLIKSRIFGNILCSQPFLNFGGITSDSEDVSKLLLESAKLLAEKENVDYVELRSLKSADDTLPTSLHKISMTIDLNSDPDILWNNFKSKHRTNIRRAYKDGIRVERGSMELLDTFYLIMAESWRFLGTPIYSKSYFRDILSTFGDRTEIFVAYKENTPIATAFNGLYNGTVEGMWAGVVPEYRRFQPNYVLYWEMIKYACDQGFKLYHLGRSSSDSGAESFKKKWNAYGSQLYWQYILNNSSDIPQLNVSNPKFKLAINVWQKLPLGLTTTIGPLISKSIP